MFDRERVFSLGTSGHKLTIDPFGFYCFKLFIPLCQLLIKQTQEKLPLDLARINTMLFL